jgi:hypothetical protein
MRNVVSSTKKVAAVAGCPYASVQRSYMQILLLQEVGPPPLYTSLPFEATKNIIITSNA